MIKKASHEDWLLKIDYWLNFIIPWDKFWDPLDIRKRPQEIGSKCVPYQIFPPLPDLRRIDKEIDKEENKNGLTNFIKESYQTFAIKDKEVAVWMLGELKKQDCYDILSKASVNKSVNLRRMAVSALGKMEDIKVENILIRALEDDNPQVIQYAIKALQKVRSIRGKEKIEKIIKTTDKDYLKRAAEEYILSF